MVLPYHPSTIKIHWLLHKINKGIEAAALINPNLSIDRPVNIKVIRDNNYTRNNYSVIQSQY